MALIDIEGVIKNFGKGDVLKGIDLEIETGERVMIVGGNGSGKTTLLRCIIGSYQYSGTISVMELDARKNKSELARYISYVPQLPPPLSITVRQLIEFVSNISNKDKDYFYEMLGILKFDDNGIDRSFKKLSGGMQKKVLMAVALGRQPTILILDEPMAHVDPKVREIISSVVNNLDKDITIIFTSHREEKTGIKASRVIEMDNGEIVRNEGNRSD